MDSWVVAVIFVFLLIVSSGRTSADDNTSFYENYKLTWGFGHALLSNQEREIQLSLYSNSGGAGFESKVPYASGFFHIRMKIPDKNSSGVVTTFYITSRSDNHDEIDIEMLGNNGPPCKLHTNLFTNGRGNREQRLNLWFDPTKDFHSYRLLWNEHQVV
ncbi:hypothetical protein Pint_01187 [Pistacia integerrima]|uniref:Uncharacterized protein n=1 Tax=Pistacia integerrima TaxID=434235 RepID=A0ACC0ZR98_9ROSI|nr:hypothetical protein Pint_01187 [Pistacia integerrima]